MYKPKLICSIIAVILLVSFCNSFSQENETDNVSGLTTNQQMKDNNAQSVPFKLHNSKQTQFDNTAIIEFELGEDANVILTVSDSKGKIVETLVDELMYAGVYNV
ncbi:MAG: hypothetical protein LH629_14340, partial [Ignavibacteria bacterium]|nr:hypothetical protein [Ignavibacteria bacterium]